MRLYDSRAVSHRPHSIGHVIAQGVVLSGLSSDYLPFFMRFRNEMILWVTGTVPDTRDRWAALFSFRRFLNANIQEDEWTRKQPATVTADGVVTLDGKPIDGASIVSTTYGEPIHPSSAASGQCRQILLIVIHRNGSPHHNLPGVL